MKGKVNYLMVSMSFRLRFLNPITSVEPIFPNSFALRFTKNVGGVTKSKVIEFDFKSYSFYNMNDRAVDCYAKDLECETFPSAALIPMLKEARNGGNSLEWVFADAYLGNDPETGVCCELLGITDVVIEGGGDRFQLPDYHVVAAKSVALSQAQIQLINKIMWDATGFCTAHLWNEEANVVKLFESNGLVYLRTLSGDGYFFNIESGYVSAFGANVRADQVDRAREVFENVIDKLGSIPFPVNCIEIPYSGGNVGYYVPSKRENGAYDIILM